MPTHCPPDAYDQLLESLRAAGQPLKVEALVKVWARENYDELVKVAFRAMREPPCTQYTIEPLTFIAFPSEEARQSYYADLYEARKTYRRATAKQIAVLHTARFIVWVRKELEDGLAGLAREATYAPSQDEVPEDQETVS